MLSRGDQAQLAFFYGEGANLLSGGSSLGPQLEHLEMYAVPGPCTPDSEVTAWPTREYRREASFEPDDCRLHRFARIAKRLRLLAEIDNLHVSVFEAYYGAVGDRFSRTKLGRMAALISLTATGKKLIAKSRASSAGIPGLNEALRFENDIMGASDIGRKALVQRAMNEAYELWDRACDAWSGEGACSAAAE